MKIKELLTDESRWTRKHLCRDKDGNESFVFSENAHSFCLIGASYKCYRANNCTDILRRIRDEIATILNVSWDQVSIGKFNDSELTSFEDIKGIVFWNF